MDWYYADQDKQNGPISEAAFQRLVTGGVIREDTLVWHEGMSDWKSYGDVKRAQAPSSSLDATVPNFVVPAGVPAGGPARIPAAVAVVSCCECGRKVIRDEAIRHGELWVCADCKPVFLQRIREGVPLQAQLEYAGFWIRFLAKFVDGIIMGIGTQLILIPLRLVLGRLLQDSAAMTAIFALFQFVIQIGLQAAYVTYFLGTYSATPGKMACGLKVVRPDGSPLTYGRACGRYFAEMLSGLTLGIGYIIAAFDEEKRSLHDRIVDTRVVKK